jgi:exopolysaccharide biosynthesis polyprenyl glycosylphosphotransferase
MIKAYSFAILFTIGISFLLKNDSYSRLVVVGYWGSLILLSILLRLIKRRIYFSLATSGLVSKNVLIVGAGKVGQSLVEELNSNKWLGYKVAGLVDDDIEKYKGTEFYLGNIENIRQIVNTQPIDELIITIPSERELVNQLLKDFRKIDININIIPDMFNLVMSSVKIGNINALPVVTLIRTPMRGIGFIAKRMFDMIVACILLLILSPVLLITGILIKLSSEGPAIYKQQRIGKHGRLFNMYKFRSMVVDADKLLRDLELNNEVDGLAFKIKNDPRITPVGKFIRKYSIDELPQLINVLVGDMSLVGPRPPVPHEVERYGDWEWRRLEVLPGMTGLWQVSGRSDLSFQQWMNMDVYYIENWSLGLDIKIMFKTISVVMKGEGAY